MRNNMLKKWNLVFLIIGLFFCCASIHMVVRYDNERDFKSYKTFGIISMMPVKTKTMPRPIFGRELFDEIKSSLKRKGLREASHHEPIDLMVYFYFMWKNQKSIGLP